MANERLKPFRDYSEHDVINLFAFADHSVTLDSSTVIYAGSIVTIMGENDGVYGWRNHDNLEMMDDAGAGYNNVVSQRWGLTHRNYHPNIVNGPGVKLCRGGLDEAGEYANPPLGIMLSDVREYDENGELLKFNPQKAAQLQASLSGQAVPIVTRGTFLFGADHFVASDLRVGSHLYASGAGQLTTTKAQNCKVGFVLGSDRGDDGETGNSCLVRFDATIGFWNSH